MKFAIKNTGENTINLMRKIGYLFQKENQFVRPLERSGYPRFHLYIKTSDEELILNLHLDQKRPVYPHTKRGQGAEGAKLVKGSPRYGVRVYKTAHDHAAEYEGKVIETEAERIKQILK